MTGCAHSPRCHRDPGWCWPGRYVADLIRYCVVLDPVRLAATRSPGLAARVRERLDHPTH